MDNQFLINVINGDSKKFGKGLDLRPSPPMHKAEHTSSNFLKAVLHKFYMRPAILLKKRLAQVFSCEFCELSKNTFFTEHLLATASHKFWFTEIIFSHNFGENFVIIS